MMTRDDDEETEDLTPQDATARRFSWDETREVLADFDERYGAVRSADGRGFCSRDGLRRIDPPAVQALPPVEDADAAPFARPAPVDAKRFLEDLADTLPSFCLVLLRAGSFALGYWEGEELVLHKAKKRYVTRGKGRAQPTHLKTKGKSRYGSRLRLQNAKAQLEDLNTRLEDIDESYGRPEQAWLACPTRMQAEVYKTKPAPPWPREDWRRVRLHVHEPGFEELLRVRGQLLTGTISAIEI